MEETFSEKESQKSTVVHARIFKNVDYKRVFPEASTVLDAVKATKELYPKAEEFMAFEFEDTV